MERVGSYWIIYPTQTQARRSIWFGMTGDGTPYLDAIPHELRTQVNNTEMRIHLCNGSTISFVSASDVDQLVGGNPIGVIFSEYSLPGTNMDKAWDLVRPILAAADNDGWAIMIYTPRGRNWGWTLFNAAEQSERWFTQRLSVDDTRRADGSPVISPEAIEDERIAGMDESLIQQEFYVDWDVALSGAYYAEDLKKAEAENRITNVPIEATLDLEVSMDLGMDDSTALICFQVLGDREVRVVGYYESSGEGLAHYVQWIRDFAAKHKVRVGRIIAPHDIEVRELGTGVSRKEMLVRMGIRVTVAPKLKVQEGIDQARRMFPLCWFDKERCGELLELLAAYRKEWNEKNKAWRMTPVHDYASHAADSFRYYASVFRPRRADAGRAPIIANTDFDVFG